MKIAVIGTKGLPANQGGIERYCEELYPKIVAQGHSVDLFARSSYVKKPWFSSYEYKGVRIICLPSLPLKGLDALTSSMFGAIASILKPYDIVHFHALGPSLFSFIPRLLSSAGILVTCQGLDWQRAKWGKLSSRIIHLGEQVGVKYAHKLIVVSEDLRSYFRKTYDINAVYIPNGPGEFANSDPSFAYVKSLGLEPENYLLFLGRLVPEKRPDLLIEAFNYLKDRRWKLVLAGGISDTAEFTTKLRNMAENNQDIIFAGELRGRRLAEIVRGAGLFVLPSDLEGLPLVMLEAMREGIPVLASDIPPHQQLIGEDRGMLFEAGNLQSCIQSLQTAILQPEKLAPMAAKAQQYIDTHYNWEKIMVENLGWYIKIVNAIGIKNRKFPILPIEPETAKRLNLCLQEMTDLLYEEIGSVGVPEQKDLELILRQQLLQQVTQQVNEFCNSKRSELDGIGIQR